ncbi:MAG: TRAP transporter substrate-binding protein DctP [Firmicutes bacterium]|nr:TRAP transporter substrate-binding protein DctP [Bacillota bacterium]
MSAILNFLRGCDRVLGVILKAISGLCFILLLLLLAANVFFRLVPVFSMGWFDEIVEMTFAWMIFIGAAELWRLDEHFQVDVLLKPLRRRRTGCIWKLAIDLFCLVFAVIFFLYSYRLTLMATDTTPIFKWSKRLLYGCMPFAGALMGLYTVRNILRDLKELVEKKVKIQGGKTMRSGKCALVIFLVAALTTVLVLPGFSAAPKYNWKLASVLPDTHPVHKALLFFADKVEEKSKGQIKITVFPAGQLGQEQDYIEGMKLGTMEIAKVSSAPLGQFSPSLQVVSLPFIWRDLEHQHAVLDGPIGKRLMDDLYKNGFKGLAFLDAGFRNISTRTKPIRVPADLKGMKIRVMQSKPLIDTINAFGATAVPMGQSEVYVALQQKVIDGWENNEPTVLSFNMQEVCKYYSYTRHCSIPDILVMSRPVFDALPADLKTAVESAAQETVPVYRKIWADYIDDAVRQLKAKGMEFNEVDDIKAFQALVRPIWKEYESLVGADLIEAIAEYKTK